MRYRSKLEGKVAKLLSDDWEYEATKIPYVLYRNYTPDFQRGDVYIEVKGFFRPGDQAKYLAVQEALNEHEELVFIFSNPDKPVRKGAKLTHRGWCEKHGFRCYAARDAKAV